MAGLGTGVWSNEDDLRSTWQLDRTFEPRSDRRTASDASYSQWLRAVERARGWAQE